MSSVLYTVSNIRNYLSVAQQLIDSDKSKRIFAFYGEMGAGKTTFIQSICEYLEVEDIVSSPTFSIVNVYHTRNHGELYHFDFYRIKSIEEVFDIGYEDYFYSGNYCFIEWPEIVEALLPDQVKKIDISVENDSNSRLIKF